MRPFNPVIPAIPTPAALQDNRDPDEIDRALVARFTSAINEWSGESQIYVSLAGIACGPMPRSGLDPIRSRAKAIAEAAGWHVEIDGRGGGMFLTPSAAGAGGACSLEARSIAILKDV